MYAVIKSGGKQHRVSPGQKVKVERLSVDVGDSIVINDVLMVGSGEDVKIGTPTVAGATVQCKVVAHGLGDKIRIFKMRRRKHYQKHQGHRQGYTELEVTAVNG
ncbi:MAG: 50S ribosomal protein L21 [Burkholderiales bacterium]